MTRARGFLAEAIQFVPVITLASSFIVGGVDLRRAASLFAISAIGAVVITAVLVCKKVQLNPILLGTNLWLGIGAIAFGVPVPPLAALIGRAQGFSLYLCVLAVGIALTAAAPTGYIGIKHPDRRMVQRLGVILLGVTVAATIWSFIFMSNIRVGGALPFIALNVTRRVMIRRARRR